MKAKEIEEIYGIKQATAYKWRNALTNLGMEITQENLDKIKNGEINLSQALKGTALVSTVKPSDQELPDENLSTVSTVEVIETTVETNTVEVNKLVENPQLFGMSSQRLVEINATVELEVMVEDALYEHHRQKRRAERAQRAAQTAKEVAALDPKKIVELAMSQIDQFQGKLV